MSAAELDCGTPLHSRAGLANKATCKSTWNLEFGARPAPTGVQFKVWAPKAKELAVVLAAKDNSSIPLTRIEADIFVGLLTQARAGDDYFYLIDGGVRRPDPVSRWQPKGVHGASRVVDPDEFRWSDHHWKGIELKDYVLYELHVGTFTGTGTFEAIIERLSYLRELGITVVELMPVVEFPGERNWGYDGVDLYAPTSSYGGPSGLKKLIDACHQVGLGVCIDVVYNHLGPEGNYLANFAPYFTDRYRTPWGDAINFDGPESDGVRRFFVENALYWLTEFHADSLRLDAIHGIYDFGTRHILQEIGEAFHRQAELLGRQAFMVAESDLNDPRVIKPAEAGGYGLDSQWNDDFHHSLHTLLTGDRHGYFVDFGRLADLRKSVVEGFVYDGRYSVYRRRRHGQSSADRLGEQFVVFTQNHDQVANGCGGQRLSELVSVEQQRLATVFLLCAPNLPLLFMGQEFGATNPFLYFTSFDDPALARAVSEGRKREFAGFFDDFVDPQAPESFARSRLNWAELRSEPHAALLKLYRDLIALRKTHPALSNCRKDLLNVQFDESAKWMCITRGNPAGESSLLLCNFAANAQDVPLPPAARNWQLAIWSADPHYGGQAGGEEPQRSLTSSTGQVVGQVRLSKWACALYFGNATPERE